MRVLLRSAMGAAAVATAMFGLAGCGNTTPAAAPTVTVTSTATTTVTATSSSSPSASGTAAATAKDLVATAAVKATLLQVGAAARSLTVSDFTGLAKDETYYAEDLTTGTLWAGARLIPSSSSMAAEVSAQDDGSYSLFEKTTGGSWQVFDVGLAQPGQCPVAVPASILTLWGWPAQGCRPANV